MSELCPEGKKLSRLNSEKLDKIPQKNRKLSKTGGVATALAKHIKNCKQCSKAQALSQANTQ